MFHHRRGNSQKWFPNVTNRTLEGLCTCKNVDASIFNDVAFAINMPKNRNARVSDSNRFK